MADSDVFDEVRNAAPQAAPDDSSDVFAEVRNAKAAPVASTGPAAPGPPSTWMSAAKGVGEAGLAVGAGTLKAITSAANNIIPGKTQQQMQDEINKDPILNYKGGPEAQPILSALQKITAPISAVGSAIHQGISDATSPRTADVVGDVRGAVIRSGLDQQYLVRRILAQPGRQRATGRPAARKARSTAESPIRGRRRRQPEHAFPATGRMATLGSVGGAF